jgi:hypothetical protein
MNPISYLLVLAHLVLGADRSEESRAFWFDPDRDSFPGYWARFAASSFALSSTLPPAAVSHCLLDLRGVLFVMFLVVPVGFAFCFTEFAAGFVTEMG